MRGVTITTSLCAALCLSLAAAEADPDPRGRQAARPRAFDFAADVNEVVGEITEEFSCDGLDYGYYADQFQDCKVFHICMPVKSDTGKILDTFQFSFFCPNQTRFSQDTKTCISDVYAYPCHNAHKLYDLNKAFGHQPKNRKKPLNTSFRKSVGVVPNTKNSENIADLFKSKRRKENTKLKIDKPATPFIPQLTSPFTLKPNARTTPIPITESSFASTSQQHNLKNEAVNSDSGSSKQTKSNRGQAIHKNSKSSSLSSFNNVVVNNNQAEPIIPGGAKLFSQTSTNVKKSQSHGSKVTSIKKVPSGTSSTHGSSSLSSQDTNTSGNQGNSNNNVNSKNVVNNISTGSNTFGTSRGSSTFGHGSSASNFDSSKHTDTKTSNIGTQKVSVVLAGNQISSVSSTAGTSDSTNTHGSSTTSFNGLNTARGSSASVNRGSVRGSSSIDTSKISNTFNKASHNAAIGSSTSVDLNSDRGSSNVGVSKTSNAFTKTNINTGRVSSVANNQATISGSSNNINTGRGSSVTSNQAAIRGTSNNINTGRGSSVASNQATIRGSSNNINTGRGSSVTSNQSAVRGTSNNINTGRGSSVASNQAVVRGTSNNINTGRGSSVANNQASIRGSSNNINTGRGSSVTSNQAAIRGSSNINTSRGSSIINKGSENVHNTGSSITTLSNSQHFKNSGIGLSSGNQGSSVSSNVGTSDFTNTHGSSTASFNGLKAVRSSSVSNTAKDSSVSVNRGSVRGSSSIDTSKISSTLNKASHNTARGSTVTDNQAAIRGSSNINTSRGSSSLHRGGSSLHNTGLSGTTSSNSQNFKNSGIGLSSASFSSTGASNSVIFGSNDDQSTSTDSTFVSGKVKNNSPLPAPINIPGAHLVSVSKRPIHAHTVSFNQHNAGNNIKSSVNFQSHSDGSFNSNSQFKTLTDASVIVGKPAVPSVGRGITTILGSKTKDNTQNTFSSQSRGSSSAAQIKSSTSLGVNQSQTSAIHPSISSHHGSLSSGNRNANSFDIGKVVKNNIGIHKNTNNNNIKIPGFSPGVHRVNGHLESGAVTSSGHTSTFGTTLPIPITTNAPFVSRPIHSTNVPQTSTIGTNTERSSTQTTGNQHFHSSSINSSNNVKQNSFSNTKKSTGIPFPGRTQSTKTSSLNTNTGRLRGSGVTATTGNQNANSNNKILSGVKLSSTSTGDRSPGASLTPGSGISEQNQRILNSGRRTTVSQTNVSGTQSQRRGSNRSRVSSSSTTGSRLSSSTVTVNTGNHNDNSHGQGSLNSNNRISSGINLSGISSGARLSGASITSVPSSHANENLSSSNILSGSGISDQNQILNSGRRGSAVSQINVSGTQSQRRGSNRSQVSSSTTGSTRKTSRGSRRFKMPTGIKFPGKSHSQSTSNTNISTFSNANTLKVKTRGGSNSQATLSNSHITASNGLPTFNKHGASITSKANANLPQPPSIPGATLIGVTRRPVKKQSGFSSQSENKVVHDQGTVHKVSQNVQSQRSSTSNTGRVASQLTGTFNKHGASVTSKANANLPQPPSIPGATLIGVTRRPIKKQSGFSSQSESKVVHDQGTVHKVSHNVQSQRSSTSTTGRVASQLTGTSSQSTSRNKTPFNSNKQNSSNFRSTSKLSPPSIPGATLIGVTRRPVQSKSSTKQAGFRLKTESKTHEVNTAPKLLPTIQRQRGSTVLGGTSKSNGVNIPSSINIPGAKLVSVRKRPINSTVDSQTSNINVHNSFTTVNAGSIIGKPAVSLHGANIASSNVQQNNAFTVQLGKTTGSQQHSHTLQKQNSNAQVNRHTQSFSVSNNNRATNELLSSVVTNSINQGSRVGITGSSQVRESSSQGSSGSFGTNKHIQKENVSSTSNRGQAFIDNSNQNVNLRKTSNPVTTRTPSRRRGSSRGRGNSHTSSNVNLSSNQVTNQANAQKTISNTPTVVATHSNAVVSQSGSVLTNAPRRTISRNRGNKKFTASPFLLQSHFAGSSLTNLNNAANSNTVSHGQNSHSSRTQSKSRNVNSRKNTVLSHNSQRQSQVTLNTENQNHHTVSTSNPTLVSPASFITTTRGHSQNTFQPVKNTQRSKTVNQEKIAVFSDFEIELTTSPMNDATTPAVTEAPLLQSTVAKKRSRGRAITNISRRVASNSLSSRNNARNSPVLTQVTTTPSPNIQTTASFPDTTLSLTSRRTTQRRSQLRPTQPSLSTLRAVTASSRTSSDASSRSRLRSQIKTSNTNTQGSTSSKSSRTISARRPASASSSTLPKLQKGHSFKLPTNFNFPGATLIAFKTTPVKKAKQSSKSSTPIPSNAFKTITDVESSIGKPAFSISSSGVETKDELLKKSELETNTNTNNNERKIIRKKIRINGRPGSRKSDAKDLISSSQENSFDSSQSERNYGAKTTFIPENSRVTSPYSTATASLNTNSYGVETETVTPSSIRIAYGGNSNSDSSKRLSSARRKTYGSDNSSGNESEANNSRIVTSARRKSYGSDSSDTSKIITSTSRRTYGSDTSSESSALNNDNSRILTSTRRNSYGSDTSSESSTHNKQASSTSSSSFSNQSYGAGSTSVRRKTYGSDSSDKSKILTSTNRRTYGSDTSSKSPSKTDDNSRILTSTRRKSYGSGTSSESSTHNKQASSTSSSSSFSTQTYGSGSTSSFSQNAYGSDTSSESSFSNIKSYGSSSSSNSSFSQRSSTASRRTYGNDVQTESSSVSSFSSLGTQGSESASQTKSIGNNHFRNVQPQIAIVTEIIPTTPVPSRQGSRRRVTSRRRLVNKTKIEPKIVDQNAVNTKSTSTSTTRGNTNTSRRKVLKKVTKLSKNNVNNEQIVPDVSEIFTPPAPILSTTTSSSSDMVSSSSLGIPGIPPGLKLRVVGTSIKSSTSTRTSSSKTKNTKNNFGNTSIGNKETKPSGNSLTDLEIEALSALAKVNTGFSNSVRGRSLRRTRQRQNSKVSSS